MLSLFLPLFLVFLLLGMPVFFALLVSPGLLLYFDGQTNYLTTLYRNVYNGMDSFPLMAIPFFMVAGELMNRGGITERIIEFAQALMGHLRGGLAHVNILSSILFAGLSGSAVADVSALGSMLIPAMEKQGYTRPFAAAITAASSLIGPVINLDGCLEADHLARSHDAGIARRHKTLGPDHDLPGSGKVLHHQNPERLPFLGHPRLHTADHAGEGIPITWGTQHNVIDQAQLVIAIGVEHRAEFIERMAGYVKS